MQYLEFKIKINFIGFLLKVLVVWHHFDSQLNNGTLWESEFWLLKIFQNIQFVNMCPFFFSTSLKTDIEM